MAYDMRNMGLLPDAPPTNERGITDVVEEDDDDQEEEDEDEVDHWLRSTISEYAHHEHWMVWQS